MKITENLYNWIDQRIPIKKTTETHLTLYYAPKNFNIWYIFGALSIAVLGIQIVSGIWLAMFYKPDAQLAFNSIETIMRDVEWGWLIRYLHTTGASFFFIVVYLHMYRALLYGSYQKPRELLWLLGCVLFLMLMAESFMGYLLPWGQLSFWGAQVIISIFTSIPLVGESLATWIRGDFVISDATLNRFFSLHVVAVPLMICLMVYLHIIALHQVGSNNPDGIEIKKNKNKDGIPYDGIPFHPFYTVKDFYYFCIFLFIFLSVVFYKPDMFGYFIEAPNYEPANSLKTPEHIVPVWYLTPFYAMLRAVPDKLFGAITMFSAIFVMFLLPWLDKSPVKSIRYKGNWSKLMLILFTISYIVLGILGASTATELNVLLSRTFTIIYFLYFITMPLYTKFEKCKPEPKRVT